MGIRIRVLIIVGYFDWFSGYQETALASAFAKLADTEVIASDRVSPAFSDEHLAKLGVNRRYEPGSNIEHGVIVTRFVSREIRSMVWSSGARSYIAGKRYNLIVQVMPGQGLPIAASLTSIPSERVVLYGDNRAMWDHLSIYRRVLKGAAFAVSKGLAYAFVNSRANSIYGYTQNTVDRLRPFRSGQRMQIMPLAYDSDRFFFDEAIRNKARKRLGLRPTDIVLISAGKFDQRKRLDWVVRAFEGLAPHYPRLQLLLVGADNSEHSRNFRELVARSRQVDRIMVLDFVDATELNTVFNASDLGIWPQYPAITIQQAMGTGLPVVLPENDLVGHLVRSGDDTGDYYDLTPGNESDCIEAALSTTLRRFAFTISSRRRRVTLNSWLCAETIVRDLLPNVSGVPRRSTRKGGRYHR